MEKRVPIRSTTIPLHIHDEDDNKGTRHEVVGKAAGILEIRKTFTLITHGIHVKRPAIKNVALMEFSWS